MAAIHTDIPASALPTALTEPNRITTTYESFSLIPRLGPLSYAYYRNRTKGVFIDLNRTLDLLERVERHRRRWKEIPASPKVPVGTVMPLLDIPVVQSGLKANPREKLNALRNLKQPEVRTMTRRATIKKAGDVDEAAKAEEQTLILSMLAKPNLVLSRLAEKGLVLDDEAVVSPKLLEQAEPARLNTLLREFKAGTGAVPRQQKQLAGKLVNKLLGGRGRDFPRLKQALGNNQRLKADLITCVAGTLKHDRVLDSIKSIDDAVIAESREWAFLRKERVELDLKTPRFRGPVALDSVAPNSELTVSQSLEATTESGSATLQQSSDRLTGRNVLSSQIEENMGTLFDYGSNLGQTMSEQGYGRDAFRGEKRASVEATLRAISEQNLAHSLSTHTTTNSQVREYHTMGKDSKFATSEVAFEAFMPVTATHWLDAIQAVWCPRIKNPYLALQRTINEYQDTVEAEYIQENYVADPAEPQPTYEGITRVSETTVKWTDDDMEDGATYEDWVTIELSENELAEGYILDRDVRLSFKYDNEGAFAGSFDSSQYTVYEPLVDHSDPRRLKVHVKFKLHDENVFNPNSMWVEVSVSKFKQTQAYREQKLEYDRIRNEVNPARRAAVEVQAKKYARLKREELIRKYENNPKELQDYAFISLMKEIFQDADNGHWSYYLGIVKSAIDWNRARVEPEPCAPENLAATGLSPYHFLNVNAVRFFLPLHPGAEEAFFNAVGETADDEWEALFNKVQDYIAQQRDIVERMRERMNDNDIAQLKLDEYESELVLGRHLESVLSKHPFATAE